jgi:hypothetical protein
MQIAAVGGADRRAGCCLWFTSRRGGVRAVRKQPAQAAIGQKPADGVDWAQFVNMLASATDHFR